MLVHRVWLSFFRFFLPLQYKTRWPSLNAAYYPSFQHATGSRAARPRFWKGSISWFHEMFAGFGACVWGDPWLELTTTVENQERGILTATSGWTNRLRQSRIQTWFFLLLFLSAFVLKLQSLELVLLDATVIRALKTIKSCSVFKRFLRILLSVRKNQVLERQ